MVWWGWVSCMQTCSVWLPTLVVSICVVILTSGYSHSPCVQCLSVYTLLSLHLLSFLSVTPYFSVIMLSCVFLFLCAHLFFPCIQSVSLWTLSSVCTLQLHAYSLCLPLCPFALPPGIWCSRRSLSDVTPWTFCSPKLWSDYTYFVYNLPNFWSSVIAASIGLKQLTVR